MRKRVLVAITGGIALSVLGLALAKLGGHRETWWSFILIVPGFVVAAFTPGFGVHSNNPGFEYLMVGTNVLFYGLLVYWCYPIIARLKRPK